MFIARGGRVIVLFATSWILVQGARAGDFFTIGSCLAEQSPPKDALGIYARKTDPVTKAIKTTWTAALEVQVRTDDRIQASTTYAKAYFFGPDKRLLATASPAKATHGKNNVYDQPFFFENRLETLYFPIPPEAGKQQWTTVLVFGDSHEVAVKAYPTGTMDDFDFPEKALALNPPSERIERKPPMDPLIEYVVKTEVPAYPQFTLFLRPPIGLTDATQAKGVLALCLLGNQVADIKHQLQGIDSNGELSGIFRFAQENQLLILCWGAHRMWDVGKNYEDQTIKQNQEMEASFDKVSDAWANGVEFLGKKYGFSSRDFMLWGSCGAGQFACRLALHQPAYFLAVHIHIPASFDKPVPEASHILWCLTTGEQYSGYERSLSFYKQCSQLGYPMVYKAYVGLGHAGSPKADALGLEFFKYALSVRDQYDALNDKLAGGDQLSDGRPWLASFQRPPFVGDCVNQGIVSLGESDSIPSEFRVSLPTKTIADIWNQ